MLQSLDHTRDEKIIILIIIVVKKTSLTLD